MHYPTKKAALIHLAGAEVTATQLGGYTADDWDAYRADKRAQWEALGYTVTEPSPVRMEATHPTRPGVAAYIVKPTIPRVRVGVFKHKSGASRYAFEWDGRQSTGEVSDLKVSADGEALELTMFNGAVMRYTRKG